MTKTMVLGLVAALAVAGVAGAQSFDRDRDRDRDRRGGAVLYELPDFGGRQVEINGAAPNLNAYGFNDRAHSVRLRGSWRVCEHANFAGRCQELRGDVANLNALGLAERVSSLHPADQDDRPGGGGGWGGRPDREARGVEGARSVFFPRPSSRGLDVAAGANGANSFCRRQGLGAAVYFDSSERAAQAVGPEGQVVGGSTVLRDLLCRKY